MWRIVLFLFLFCFHKTLRKLMLRIFMISHAMKLTRSFANKSI
ncbi:hypothetical protein AAHE18_04G148300 [Arachis hypogaea]